MSRKDVSRLKVGARVRWWPHTRDPQVASYRLRCLQIVETLAARGVDASIHDPAREAPPQLLVLSKRYDADSLARACELRSHHGTRLLLDLCDNHFHVDNADPRLLERAGALKEAVASADRVVVSSQALAEVVRAQCPQQPHITVIADAAEQPFDPEGWSRLRHPRDELALRALAHSLARSGISRERRLLWFGNHGSLGTDGGMNDLQLIREALERAHVASPLALTVISNHAQKFAALTQGWTIPVFYLPWRAHTFSRAARLHSAAVIPASLNPFTRCKTNNRVATAFLHELNVIATAIPSYEEFVGCAVLDDWPRGLGPYLDETARRAREVAAGRQLLAERYTLEVIAARWQQVIAAALHTNDKA